MAKRTNVLTVLIVLGLLLGIGVGEMLYRTARAPDESTATSVEPDGERTRVVDRAHSRRKLASDVVDGSKVAGDLVLIRPLKLMIVPIVFVSVIVGVTSVGNPSKLGVIGGATVLYYLVTMLLAVSLGATLVSTFQPGDIDPEKQAALRADASTKYQGSNVQQTIETAEAEKPASLGTAFINLVKQLIPSNIVKEMAEGRTLPIIVFALIFGLALAAGGEVTAPVIRVFEGIFDAIMRLVLIIIWITPVGVFLLMTYTVGSIGIETLIGPISKYIAVVLAGLAIHGCIVLPTILYLFSRKNPFRFMWQMRKALMTAFGTDSSSATLPVTLETAEHEGGCSKRAANFVLPLGSTVNMDGTALYEAVAVVFLFQLYGVDLGFSELLIVVITATLAAVGAAGVPSAGLIMMVIVINAVNTSLGRDALPMESIGVIIGVDRIVDMCRTTVNVWGDAVGAKIITRIAPDTEEDMEAALG
ncbi:MAG: dicarboxylate/amino acid:cation symporter [Planctomycetes bacterium]|nr:dicarboxylate/amino acid:cation symporter [Planctomycetota bacterium]